ncbi:MAG: hypothetical protein QM530_10860 [Phycisphaerales bacterium]|nr:hypothetical protein [Phycisphaerales bacterium]
MNVLLPIYFLRFHLLVGYTTSLRLNTNKGENILSYDELMEKLKKWTPQYPGGSGVGEKRLHKLRFKPRYFSSKTLQLKKSLPQKAKECFGRKLLRPFFSRK